MIRIQDLQIFATEADSLLFFNESYQNVVTRIINDVLAGEEEPWKFQLFCHADRLEIVHEDNNYCTAVPIEPGEYDPDDENCEQFEIGVIYHDV